MRNRTPIEINELPEGLRLTLTRVTRLTYPRQGWTSDVAIAQTNDCRVVIKRSRGPPFSDWLEQEHKMLTALVPGGLPVPKPIYYERSRPEEAAPRLPTAR